MAGVVTRRFFSTQRWTNKTRHWLDAFDGLHEMLERSMRTWWFKGLVESRCRSGSDLEGVDKEALRLSLEDSYQGYMKKYGTSLDSRTKMHVSCACLVMATHATLASVVCGHNADERILEIIQEHHGSKSKPLLQTMLRWTSVLTTYKSMQQRLRYLQLDYGGEESDSGFLSTLKQEGRISTLRIHRCLYEEIFRAEEKGFLLQATCCQADKFWLSSTSSRSFTGGLASSKALGDPECVFYVSKK